MKALLLSLVIAFTGSFALACPLAPDNITQSSGSLVKSKTGQVGTLGSLVKAGGDIK